MALCLRLPLLLLALRHYAAVTPLFTLMIRRCRFRCCFDTPLSYSAAAAIYADSAAMAALMMRYAMLALRFDMPLIRRCCAASACARERDKRRV